MIKTMVIDDTADMRMVIIQALKQGGFPFAEAETVEEAVAKITADADIKLVLLDLLLPDIDGLTFLQETATLRAERGIKVIVVSGKRDRETVAKAIQLGASDYIVKPIYPGALIAKINSLFRLGTAKDQYIQISTQLKAKLNDSLIHPDIQINSVTEIGLAILASAFFDINSQIKLSCMPLSVATTLPSEFLCRVTSCVKVGFGKYQIEANFVALTEDIATKIRSLAIRGEKINEQPYGNQ